MVSRKKRLVRTLAIVLTFVSTIMNSGELLRLIDAILAGHAAAGRTLLLDAVNIWATNVVIFCAVVLDDRSKRTGGSGPPVRRQGGFSLSPVSEVESQSRAEALDTGLHRLLVSSVHERDRLLPRGHIPAHC